MTATWTTIGWDNCILCGDAVEVLTDCEPGFACTDDEARCVNCGLTGIVDIEDDGEPWIDWRQP